MTRYFLHLFACILLLTNPSLLKAQEMDAKTQARLQADANKVAEDRRKELMKDSDYSGTSGKFRIDYEVEMLRIETLMNLKIDEGHQTTTVTVIAITDATKDYDKMLNKYYQILLKKLQPKDQEILKQAQRNWITYKEAELKLNLLITDDKYTGGSLERIYSNSRVMNITKHRLEEIYGYLERL